ncbi:DUF4421 family protein [Pontibacter sp. 172403-2]|uniref:DUF4421 family protein n=1 Tax=Pontibacter rufus TaxID=2791028 RepID=UPI0018AF9D37|nr:DUF4421 family protein [Pontibacter sp. 172403-2]MBF9254541.1 DUF4421 family protein [Pontibacter sp. 172403-2]
MPFRLLFLFLSAAILLLPGQAEAQEGTGFRILGIHLDSALTPKPPKVDTAYIASYNRMLHVHLLLEDTDYALRFIGDQDRVIYKPNVSSSVGIGVSYSWLSFHATIPTPNSGNDEAEKGKTDQFKLGISLNGRKLWFDTNYQQYKGLYLSNPEVLAEDWFQQNTGYPVRPDVSSKAFLARVYYSFNNKRFSHPATTFRRERQKKSAGSFLLGGTFMYTQVAGDSSLLPASIEANFPDDANLVRYRAATYSVNVGYAHTFVFKKYLFTSLSLRPGLAVRSRSGVQPGNVAADLPAQLGIQGDGRVTFGFNSDKYYGGITGNMLFSSGSLEASNRQRSYYSEVQILFGRRFGYKAKGLLDKVPGF